MEERNILELKHISKQYTMFPSASAGARYTP